MLEGKKVVLAYSGGLDTSVCVKWLEEQGAVPYALYLDLGQGEPAEDVRAKALRIGAADAFVRDAKAEFADEYVAPAIKANALYGGKYPLFTALARPLIAKKLVEAAREVGATHIAHGSTGKGNDQVRFDVTTASIAPDLTVVAPVRDWNMSRPEEMAYAEEHGIPVPTTKESPYSVDENLWGRSIEAGPLEDPDHEPTEDVFELTTSPENAPDEPQYVEIGFEEGLPTTLDGEELPLVDLIAELNAVAGANGVGRIDMIEDRLVGIKSREIYESPAALDHHLRPPRTRDPDPHQGRPPLQNHRRTTLRRTRLRGPVVHPPQNRPRRLHRGNPEDRNRLRPPQTLQGQRHRRRPHSPKRPLQQRPRHLRPQQHLRRGRSSRLHRPLGPLSPPVGKRQRRYRVQRGTGTTLNFQYILSIRIACFAGLSQHGSLAATAPSN